MIRQIFPALLGLFMVVLTVSCGGREGKEGVVDEVASYHQVEKTSAEKYEAARNAFEANQDDPEANIWYGRRAAYLGNFEEAIDIFTMGIEKHPEDARFLRHRGHRYISTRQYDKAIADFERAAALIAGKEDTVEPDGLPNDRNIPLSTLHGNIWYHLGLAHYLQNDLEKALAAFSNRTVLEKYDDNLVSGGHWLFMILSRLGREAEAQAAIADVVPGMDIIENDSYYKMCLFYRGLLAEEDLQPAGKSASSDDVLDYGLGNWYLYAKQDTATARQHFEHLLTNGNKYSFAYLAAETDWERLFAKPID
ncbi:tetratricopeptide repeat protein [Lewinella sp. W8]|uniref:tetratricopeptide repeat protein n=1 Tax=Lewinella sp. W8 TaxID=2528208 RepID=UPI001068C426|nr:tetratricopeptide repeat protein [Lewinella sp. W8]MTB52316.1 hypothetical protein [Lewinella sp. W8]